MEEPAFFGVIAQTQDVSEQVVRLLPLAALGALACTCKRLRTYLADAPWAWQAAARGEHPSLHPIFASTDVQAYLLQQHTVRANIAARRFSAVPTHEPPWAAGWHLTSLRSGTYIVFADQAETELAVHSMVTGRLLRTLAVPEAVTTGPDSWDWDFSRSCILRSFGSAWAALEETRQTATPEDYLCSGFALLSVESGTCKVVSCTDLRCLPGSDLQLLHISRVGSGGWPRVTAGTWCCGIQPLVWCVLWTLRAPHPSTS